MDKEKDILIDLYRHELAANDAYKSVLEHIQSKDIYDTVQEFLDDHKKHLSSLSSLYESIVKEKLNEGRDLKGVVLSGYASIRSLTGESGALKALQTAEHIILRQYENALNQKDCLSESVLQLLQTHLQDEQRHNAFIDNAV